MNKETTQPSPAPRRGRRIRIALLVLACLVPLSVGYAYRYYTRPHRVRAMAEAFLQRHINGRVRIGEAKWAWLPNLRLFDVTIEGLASDGDQTPIFFCPEVRLELGLASMLLGKPSLESVLAIEPSCAVERDAVTGKFNVAGLVKSLSLEGRVPARLPNVELRDARIRLIERSGDDRRLVEDLTITARARSFKKAGSGYDITWQVEGDRPTSGHLRVDLQTGRVQSVVGGLPWMQIDAIMLAVGVKLEDARLWHDRLGLTGSVRTKHFDFGGSDPGDPKPTVAIELSDVSLSVPASVEENDLPLDQRHLRFDQVAGEIKLTPDGLAVSLAGLLHGSACELSAAIHPGPGGMGDFANAGLDADVKITGIMLPVNDARLAPVEARFVRNLAPLAKVYADYDPHGLIDLGLSVSKPIGAAERLVMKRLYVNTRGTDFSATKFPYRIRDSHGTVESEPNGEMTCALRGLGNLGTISIDGRFGKVAAGHEKRVTITASGVPFDDAFWRALPPRFESVRRQFTPSGLIDLEVVLLPTNPEDPSSKRWRSHTTATLLGVSGTYDMFPYPLQDVTGTIVIDRGSVTVADLVGHADKARVSIDGSLVVDTDGLNYLDLTIQGRNVPIDEKLLAALPPRTRDEISEFHPVGSFDSTTSLSFNTRDRKVEQVSVVSLNDIDVRCARFPLPITQVSGKLRITDIETVFDHLTGRFRDATLSVEGVSRRGDASSVLEATVRASNVRLDEETCRWLPESTLDQFGLWGIEGPIETETAIKSDPDQPGALSYRTRVTLTGAGATHPELPIAATDVRGELVVDHTGLTSAELTAKYDSADVRLRFDADEPGGDACGVTAIRANGLTLNDSVRGLLPPRLYHAWSRINPKGSLSVDLDKVQCHRNADATQSRYTIHGRADLDDVSLGRDRFITGTTGTINLEGVINDADGGSRLEGVLVLSQTSVFDHRIVRAEGGWSYATTAGGEGMLVLRPVRGNIHGGLITSDIDLEFSPEGLDYNVRTTVRNMRLESFLGAAALQPGSSSEARGTVHGQLNVTGTVDGELSPRGGGRFEIVDGHMYRLPLFLGILHVLNLSVPGVDAFDEARAEFLVVGDKIDLNDIRLRGEALALSGRGTLSWPDRSVDLTLVNVKRDVWTHGVPLFADLVQGATKEIFALHVTGQLSKPKISLEPFRAIREEFKTLFKKKKPKSLQTVGP